jgi:hypothetical protein
MIVAAILVFLFFSAAVYTVGVGLAELKRSSKNGEM